jgi:hypothetical protein
MLVATLAWYSSHCKKIPLRGGLWSAYSPVFLRLGGGEQ